MTHESKKLSGFIGKPCRNKQAVGGATTVKKLEFVPAAAFSTATLTSIPDAAAAGLQLLLELLLLVTAAGMIVPGRGHQHTVDILLLMLPWQVLERTTQNLKN